MNTPKKSPTWEDVSNSYFSFVVIAAAAGGIMAALITIISFAITNFF